MSTVWKVYAERVEGICRPCGRYMPTVWKVYAGPVEGSCLSAKLGRCSAARCTVTAAHALEQSNCLSAELGRCSAACPSASTATPLIALPPCST